MTPLGQTSRSHPEGPIRASEPRGVVSPEYDIKEVYTVLQERLDWLATQEKLDWLVNEVVRLQEENARLLDENRQLREELTLARLARELEVMENNKLPPIPREARRLYAELPPSCTFSEYFNVATAEGVGNRESKEYLRAFLRHEMLRHKGSRLEKTGVVPYPVPPIPLSRGR